MRAVMAIPAGGLLAGCAIGIWWPDVHAAPFVVLAVASAGAAAGSLAFSRDVWLVVATIGGFAGGGVLLARDAWREASRPALRIAFDTWVRDGRDEPRRPGRAPPVDAAISGLLVGVLGADAAPGANGVTLRVSVRSVDVSWSPRDQVDAAATYSRGDVLLTVGGALAAERWPEWRAGRTVRTTAQIHRPARYLNPGLPDQERALALRGISLVGSVKSGALVEVIGRGHPLAEAAASARALVRQAVAVSVGRWSPRSQGIITAILIGDRSGLDAAVERRLQEAGTYHVIAISGGNVAILAGLMLVGFRAAGVLGRAAMVTAMVGLSAYGYVAGGGASVDRATLMAVVYFFGRAVDLRAPPLNTVALAAGLLAAHDPLAVADPGFLLTVGATTAILLLAETRPSPRPPRILASVVGLLAASAAAEAALFPIGAAFFGRVTFAGLVLNLFAIPLMAIAQVTGLLVVAAFAVSPTLAAWPGWAAHVAADGLVRTADIVQFAPFVTWRVAAPSVPVVATYYSAVILAFALWSGRRRIYGSFEPDWLRAARRASAVVAACAAFWVLAEPWTIVASRGDGRLRVLFIDVGQGDAAFVRFPGGSTLLVDAGGVGGVSFDVGERVVAPVLRALGVRRLDALALTHGDADHIGGAGAVIREFRPRELWEGIPVPPSPALQALAEAAAAVGSRWRNVQAGDVVRIDGVSVVVRHPPVADWERQDVRNDDSIVLELTWRDVSIALTGDIGYDVEPAIGSRFSRFPTRIVKVPHHGSLTSSSEAFVRALAPRVAVVSAGRRNAFGHPAPAVLERYRSAGAEIFRTDQDGAVMIDTDGASIQVRTFTGRWKYIPPFHEATKTTKSWP